MVDATQSEVVAGATLTEKESFSGGIGEADFSAALPETPFGLTISMSAKASLDMAMMVNYVAQKSGKSGLEALASLVGAALKAIP